MRIFIYYFFFVDICSLRSGVDRFAFSVIWEINSAGLITKSDYCKSVIRSVASLSYEQAQNRIDDQYVPALLLSI